jgi:deazaflavin-dependent oxidoreductase (nitroreductase family)
MYEHRRANPFRRAVRVTAGWKPLSLFYARTLHHIDRVVYRVTRGHSTFVSWVTGMPVVMLTTTGAKSGRRHTCPLVALPEGDRMVVIASNYGQHRNPAWYHNLCANPRAMIRFEGVTQEVVAREPAWSRRGAGGASPRMAYRGSSIDPSSRIVQRGLWAISQAWPSGSTIAAE